MKHNLSRNNHRALEQKLDVQIKEDKLVFSISIPRHITFIFCILKTMYGETMASAIVYKKQNGC